MKNAINWFEIPTLDFNRAKIFYETILGATMQTMDFGGFKMGFLPSDEGKVGGAIVNGQDYKPSADGTLIYLNANPDLAEAESRVVAAGGKVLISKRIISPEWGFMAIITDTEGNRIGLHSNK